MCADSLAKEEKEKREEGRGKREEGRGNILVYRGYIATASSKDAARGRGIDTCG
jgi:hypothetical protein